MSVNLQEIFDKVANHLITQNRKSIDDSGNYDCVYRAYNGDMCAVGCLITDSHYNPDMEGESVYDGQVMQALSDSLEISIDYLKVNKSPVIEMLSELQHAHDYLDPEEWRADLVRVAHLFKIEYRGEQYGKQSVGL